MLFIINKQNPYFSMGSYIRRLDDGWERVVMEQKGHYATIKKYVGVVIPRTIDMYKWAVPVTNSFNLEKCFNYQRRLIL